MNWRARLQAGESLRWEGRPAPTCFCFRHWRRSLFGSFLLIGAVYALVVGVQLRVLYHHWLLSWTPVPFVLAGLYLSIGHLVHARLEWEKVFYAVTDRRVLIWRGLFRPRLESLSLDELTGFTFQPQGAELGSFFLSDGGRSRTLVLACIEHPQRLRELLEAALAGNSHLARPVPAAADTRD